MARAGVAALVALAIAVGAVGCGEDEGVKEGAVVTAYVEKPLCRLGAEQVTVSTPGGDGAFELHFICLAEPRRGGEVDLATVGANARRATEDSRTVAFLEAPDPAVNRFSHPILEAAGIGWITAPKGKAQQQVISLLLAADSDSLRADVREELGQP